MCVNLNYCLVGYLSRSLQRQFSCTGRLVLHSFRVLNHTDAHLVHACLHKMYPQV